MLLKRFMQCAAVLAFLLALRSARAAAPQFTVTLNGAAASLHEFAGGAFAVVAAPPGVRVHIHTEFEVFTAEVRPFSTGAHATVDSDLHGVSFTLARPAPVTVEFNRIHSQVLHLFVHAVSHEDLTAASPGVRYFGPGEHNAGLIELRSGETVYLAEGAWVHGRIRSRNTQGIRITGYGVLDASGVDVPQTAHGPEGVIFLDHSTGARIEGITVFNSHSWTVHLQAADGARVSGVRVLNPGNDYGDDGFDLDSSSNVELNDIFVRTNDDCIVVKNLLDLPVHGIRVHGAVLWNMPNGGNALEIGYELRREPVHDLRFDDIDMIHVEHGAALGIHNGDSAEVTDVVFANIRIEDAARKLLDIAIFYSAWSADRPQLDWPQMVARMDRGGAHDGQLTQTAEEARAHAAMRGHVRNIRVRNISIAGGAMPYSILDGYDAQHRVQQVRLEDIRFRGAVLRDAAALQLVVHNAEPPAVGDSAH